MRLLVLAALVAVASTAVGAPPAPALVRLDNPTPDADDAFGASVGWAGGVALVGSPLDDASGTDSGVVHLFAGGTAIGALAPASLGADSRFGSSLLVHGEWLFVGASGHGGAGAVFVFRGEGASWEEAQVLQGSDLGSEPWFGHSLSASGELLVVGAPFGETPAGRSGLAVVHELAEDGTWQRTAELVPPDIATGFLAGAAVAAGDDAVVVGVPYLGNSFVLGAVQLFVRDEQGAWSWDRELESSLRQGRDRFGSALLFHDGDVIAGAPRDTPPSTGFVTTFEPGHGPARDEWVETNVFVGDAHAPFDRFGAALSARGRILAVGAPTSGAGRVETFTRHGRRWRPAEIIVAPSEVTATGLFGRAIGVGDDGLLIGAPGHATTGAAFVRPER